MTKVQKWFAKLRNRIFFSFVGCFLGIMLLIMGVFQFSSQKYFSQLAVSRVKCRARVPFVTQESLFVNENLIL